MIVSCHYHENDSPNSEPYRMQSVLQFSFSALVSNEIVQDLKFANATRLDPLRIVKDITRMIGEHKFVIDIVLASLAP